MHTNTQHKPHGYPETPGTAAALKVVIQITGDDPQQHRALMAQLSHLQEALPALQTEVVVHGPAVVMVLQHSACAADIRAFSRAGIRFLVCRHALLSRRMDAASLLQEVELIPAGLAHIILRQSAGWCYIKAGF